MRFGLGQFTLQIPPWDRRTHAELYADTLAQAAQADEAGFDSFWLAEHHGAADGYNPALLPFLSAVAARTTRIEVGTAVMLAPFHDVLRVAEDAAVVANIANRRVNIGLGLGWAPEEYRMFDAPKAGRGVRLGEFAQVLRAAWTQERFTFAGEHLRFEDVSITPKPSVTPRLWLGGNVDAALERSALLADGYFPPSTQGVEALVERAATIKRYREEAGVEGPFSFGAFVPVGLGEDADDGWASIRDGILHVRGSYLLWAQEQRDVRGAREAAEPFEAQIREGAITGTPAQVVDTIGSVFGRIEAMGFDEVFLSAILIPPGTDPTRASEALDRYAREVIGSFR